MLGTYAITLENGTRHYVVAASAKAAQRKLAISHPGQKVTSCKLVKPLF